MRKLAKSEKKNQQIRSILSVNVNHYVYQCYFKPKAELQFPQFRHFRQLNTKNLAKSKKFKMRTAP